LTSSSPVSYHDFEIRPKHLGDFMDRPTQPLVNISQHPIKHRLRSPILIVAGGLALIVPRVNADEPAAEADVRIPVRVQLGDDLGQELGTLFEARDAAGKVVAGAGFLGTDNTMDRGDRRQLQFFVKVPDDGKFEATPLPRPSPGAGVYAFGLGNRLFAAARAGEVDSAVRVWDDARNAWIADPSARKHDVQIGDAIMSGTSRKVVLGDRTIVESPTADDSLTEPYYGSGILLVRRYSNDGVEPPTNALAAFSWKPGQGAVRWDAAKLLPLRPREFIYTYGQLAGKVFVATNLGTVAVYEGGAWRILRRFDGKSFQIYASLNYRDRLLLGQYPTGELFEFDGQAMRQLRGRPPVMPGVSTNAREAQTLAIYGGDLYVGVWPWGEVWRLDSTTETWRLLGRMFTHPEPTDATTHPYENETTALDPVLNRWGQRVTSMVPHGDSLYIATSAKSAAPYEEKFTFLANDKWREYGTVYRHRQPGAVSVPFDWKPNPTTFEFVWNAREIRILQDGKPLGAIPWPSSLGAPRPPARVTRGNGIFGPSGGTILPDPDGPAAPPDARLQRD
jgi:hypothetical protein